MLYRTCSNYALSSRKNETKEYYHNSIMEFIVNYPDIVEKLISSINVNDNEDQSYDVIYVELHRVFVTLHVKRYHLAQY